MTSTKQRPLFVNLMIEDIERSKRFFEALGFSFNPQFEDENGCCLVINEQAFAMLLKPDFFKTFTERKVCDTSTHTEALLCVMVTSREEVDQMIDTALATGVSVAQPLQDQGGMYGGSFYDPDGHHWEVGFMDVAGEQG